VPVVAADRRSSCARIVAENVERLGLATPSTSWADGCHPPLAPASFDHILLDAPCSGLGSLRRRPDARWRIEAADLDAGGAAA
jgi:16S rRNA (cytosine967-C5)-methyltransferase